MKIVPPTTHHRRRIAGIVFILCVLLSSLCAYYTYDTISNKASYILQLRYYGKPGESEIPDSGHTANMPPAEDVFPHTIMPNHSAQRHLVASNQVRRILTTMPSSTSCNSTLTPPKLILLWTPFFDSWGYFPLGRFDFCPKCTNCKVTTDRNRLLECDAVIFHCRDMTLVDVPHLRLPHQRWVFYCLESPVYSDFPGIDFMKNMFNWTMTYRSDSDITVPYGRLEKVPQKRTWDKMSLLDVWRKKTKSIVWMTSHCPTFGNRDAYVNHLKKYIDVDVYGTCGTMVCPKSDTHECLQRFSETYKFYLAFENSICRDYVTEKFYRTFNHDIIPVVFGGADYEKHAPRGSYIDALSFQSPKHLAFFLSGVGSDFALYSAYFRWREDFVVNLTTSKECYLCDRLHERSPRKSVYEDMREWWVDKGQCRTYGA